MAISSAVRRKLLDEQLGAHAAGYQAVVAVAGHPGKPSTSSNVDERVFDADVVGRTDFDAGVVVIADAGLPIQLHHEVDLAGIGSLGDTVPRTGEHAAQVGQWPPEVAQLGG